MSRRLRRRNTPLPPPPEPRHLRAFAAEVETAVRQLDAAYPPRAVFDRLVDDANGAGSAFARDLRALAVAIETHGA